MAKRFRLQQSAAALAYDKGGSEQDLRGGLTTETPVEFSKHGATDIIDGLAHAAERRLDDDGSGAVVITNHGHVFAGP